MTPAELQAWRDRHGMTNHAAAEALCVSPRYFLNLIYGQAPISDRVARMAALVEHLLENTP